jgi:hypothetical protein
LTYQRNDKKVFMALYLADDGVTPVTTQSMIKAFRMCPREAYYKYYLRLSPKVASIPLTRGKWIHSVLEAHYLGNDWREVHAALTHKFSLLMDEEKEKLGDLPREIEILLASYFWHYSAPEFYGTEWTVHEVERLIEARMPNGHLFRGKVDMIVENEFGLWIVDHKTHGRLPNWEYRMLDEQSTLYTWAARENDIPVQGFIWNYITTKPFPKYEVLKNGSSFYAKSLGADSTYVALTRSIKRAQAEYGDQFLAKREDKAKVIARLSELKNDRWKGPDVLPTSPYFRRDILEKDDELIERTLKSVMRTSDTMHSYDFTDPDCVERDVKSCEGFFCNFRDLSMSDLVMGESTLLQKRNYKNSDPLAYHQGNDELG